MACGYGKLIWVLPAALAQRVAATPLDVLVNDRPCWKANSTSGFSLKSAWELVREGGVKRPLFKELWHPLVSPSISILAWRLLHNFVPQWMSDFERRVSQLFQNVCVVEIAR
ncbi:UNVERIFIED_CONTAM: hypothetical protein Slati_3970300 [Sesamum latifolium]|uniref:Reverse transcriptase zinc-binding domain-containing protein n=1 Tax=Sesamum latifolium TaxID=2727402 RepID=A0AAW2TQ35_9LAMI